MNRKPFVLGILFSGTFWVLVGCNLMRGRIALPGASVTAVKDAGSPATVAQSNAGVSVPLPAGSVVTVTKSEALPATKETPAQPAKEITEIRPAGPTEYHKTEQTVAAQTGTVDTSIREHQIDAQESRPLLYAAIASALAAGFFVWRAYPTPAICCGVAAVVFFMAWKMAGLPEWFWAIGLAAIVGGGALWLGHERGLYTPVPDDKPKP